METTLTKTEITLALTKAYNDYKEVAETKSLIQLYLKLGTYNMWRGLCTYFNSFGSTAATVIIDELSIDADFNLHERQIALMPFNVYTKDIAETCIKPRLAIIEKTLQRLTNQQP